MLKPTEKTGLENILNELEDSDLFSLCDTVTKRMLRTTNRQEAIEAILSCVQKPCDLLKRQKITRRVLFNYLRGLNGTASPESSKVDLVMKCLDEWKTIDTTQAMDCNETVEMNYSTDLMTMAVEFTRWFFPLYNQLQDFGTKHFWLDVKLKAEMQSQGDNRIITIVGDKDVVTFLTSLITDDKFFFHPNDSVSSLECEQEVHGLVRITVNGILHQLNNSVGIFDTVFGLVKNPAFENNWKIKWIYLYIKATAAKENTLPLTHYHAITQRDFVYT